MKPAPPDPPELLRRIRQQLILAQVRIMELEDQRDDLTTKLSGVESLQRDTQILADEKTALGREMVATFEQNNRQLRSAREQLTALERDRDAHAAISGERLQEIESLCQQLTTSEQQTDDIRNQLTSLKKSRSWRWTGWLRALGL